jgi:hypothetical protein
LTDTFDKKQKMASLDRKVYGTLYMYDLSEFLPSYDGPHQPKGYMHSKFYAKFFPTKDRTGGVTAFLYGSTSGTDGSHRAMWGVSLQPCPELNVNLLF